MKKRCLAVLLLILILALPAAEAFAGGSVRYIYSRNGGKVNLRHGPSETGYAVAVQLEPGTEVKLLYTKKGWSKVVYNGFTLYVKSGYLSSSKGGSGTSPSSGGSSSAAAAKTRYIRSSNGKKVNARTGPGESGYAVAAQLPVGTEVGLISTKKGWSKIRYNGFILYVQSKYLSASKPGSGSSKFGSFEGKVYAASGSTVNLRTEPDKKSDVILRVPIWRTVTVVGQKGLWYKVRYGGATGYMMKRYIR